MSGALDLERAIVRLARSIHFDSDDPHEIIARYLGLTRSARDSADAVFGFLPEVPLVIQEEFLRPTCDVREAGHIIEKLVKQLVTIVFEDGANAQRGPISPRARLLDLFPHFLAAAKAVCKHARAPDSFFGGGGDLPSAVIARMLKSVWEPSMVLPLLNCFGELKDYFTLVQWHTVQRRVLETVGSILPSDFPGVAKCILNMIDASRMRALNEGWLSLLRKVLASTPLSNSANVYFVVRVAMERSPHLCDEIVDIFFHMQGDFSWPDVLVVLLASKSHGAKDSLIATLINCQRSKATIAGKAGAVRKVPLRHRCWHTVTGMLESVGSKAAECTPRQDDYICMQTFVREVVTCGSRAAGAEFAVSMAPGIIRMAVAWATVSASIFPQRAAASDTGLVKKIQSLGAEMLFVLFVNLPACQEEIINVVFQYKHTVLQSNAVSSSSITRVFGRLLHRIGYAQDAVFSKHIPKVQEWMGYILGPAVNHETARSTLTAVVPLVRYNRHFADFLLLKLRKMIMTRRKHGQYLAINGLCDLLKSCSILRQEFHVEVVEILKSVLFLSFPLRRQVIGVLSGTFQSLSKSTIPNVRRAAPGGDRRPHASSSRCQTNGGSNAHVEPQHLWPLSPEASKAVAEALWQRLLAVFVDADRDGEEVGREGGGKTTIPLHRRRNTRKQLSQYRISKAALATMHFDLIECFQVVTVRESVVYEQIASPASILECLLSLGSGTTVTDNLILVLKKFVSMFSFENSAVDEIAVVPARNIPLKQRVEITLPLCITLAEACLLACNVISCGTPEFSNRLGRVPLTIPMAKQLFELAGVLDMLNQETYDIPNIVKGELTQSSSIAATASNTGETRTVLAKMWLLEQFGKDSNAGRASSTVSIISALHAARFFSNIVPALCQESNGEPNPEGNGEILLKLFKISASAYLVASRTSRIGTAANSMHVFSALHNVFNDARAVSSGPFCPVVRRWLSENISKEERAKFPIATIIASPTEAIGTKAGNSYEHLIFFELRHSLLLIMEHLLNAIVEKYRPYRTALLIHDSVSKMIQGSLLETTQSPDSGVRVFARLGAFFAEQIAIDVRTTTGSFPELIMRQLGMLNRSVELQQELLKLFGDDSTDKSKDCQFIFAAAAPSLTAMLDEYKIENRKILRLVLEFIVRSLKAVCPGSEDVSEIASAILCASISVEKGEEPHNDSGGLFTRTVRLIRRCDFSSESSLRVTLPVAINEHREALMGIVKSQQGRKIFNKQQKNRNRILAFSHGPSKQVSSEQRNNMLKAFSRAIFDTALILEFDSIGELTDFVRCKNPGTQNSEPASFISKAVAFLNDRWVPTISKRVYQHIIMCLNALALTGSKICQMVNQVGYKILQATDENGPSSLGLWAMVHALFRLMLFSKVWLERIQACHANVQNKASAALLWKDKFEMQLFVLCKAHEKYILPVDRATVRAQYDDEFVSMVTFVALWRGKVSKTVEEIVHRPALKKRRGGKLRSRNVYVDEHLGVENGKDTYADLEDFIVGDSDDVD